MRVDSVRSKIKTRDGLSKILKSLKKKRKRIVFTNGCFDILHPGHISYLKKARALGDILVVGLNSDNSVRKLKGPPRPITPQKKRAELLGSLEFVDFITIFNESTPFNLIRKLKPHILVKGADWKTKDVVGRSFVESYGGKVRRIPFLKGYSTTRLIKKILKSAKK